MPRNITIDERATVLLVEEVPVAAVVVDDGVVDAVAVGVRSVCGRFEGRRRSARGFRRGKKGASSAAWRGL
ncbi:hypothetical protein ACFPH7_02155 [Arcanobacterium bovis]